MTDREATPTPTGGENAGAMVISGQVTAEDLDELDDDHADAPEGDDGT